LQFQFWEPVLYAKYDGKFPSDSTELMGRFVGIAENVGHSMTHKLLSEDGKVIHRAVARTALKGGGFANKRAEKSAPNSAPTSHVTVETIDEDGDDSGKSDDETPFIKAVHEDIMKSLHTRTESTGENAYPPSTVLGC
jgi:hypothetical protein